ncbi:tyrosine-type recombinase/integrase [Vibrio sp.]|nr:tyrosine-type recombinase/integrase [Vibrio sp.]
MPLCEPNFDMMMQLRPQLLANCDELPHYLLMPEIDRLIEAAPNNHAKIIFNMLWRTGARINELLAIRYKDIDFHTDPEDGHLFMIVTIRTLKQNRANDGKPKRGRAEEGAIRKVPVHCFKSSRAIQMHYRTFVKNKNLPLFINPASMKEKDGKREPKSWSAQVIRNWINESIEMLSNQGIELSIDVTPHTFRHSYAVHLLLHHLNIRVIQQLLGHKKISSTLVYMKIWEAESYLQLRSVPFNAAI